jgi:hypothetical protein
MRLGKKNSINLEQLDYLQDLNRLLFSNVVDQAAQKTEYYLAYYMGGGINKPAAAAKSLPKINIAARENRHVGCNSLSLCPLLVPNIFIKKKFPNNRATLASMPLLFL